MRFSFGLPQLLQYQYEECSIELFIRSPGIEMGIGFPDHVDVAMVRLIICIDMTDSLVLMLSHHKISLQKFATNNKLIGKGYLSISDRPRAVKCSLVMFSYEACHPLRYAPT